MGRKKTPGLVKRGGALAHRQTHRRAANLPEHWKQLSSKKPRTSSPRLTEETRQAQFYGIRPQRTFEQAAAKFVLENTHKRSLEDDVSRLKQLMPWIGQVSLDRLHSGHTRSVDGATRRQDGTAAGTINHGLQDSATHPEPRRQRSGWTSTA